MSRIKERLGFKKGSGEFIGFAVVMPFIFIIILYIVNVLQIGVLEEKLTFAAYSCGRAAVISSSSDAAYSNAVSTLEEIQSQDGLSIGGTDVKVSISGNAAWVKGNIIIVDVSCYFEPVLGIQRGEHTRRVAMMIEHSEYKK